MLVNLKKEVDMKVANLLIDSLCSLRGLGVIILLLTSFFIVTASPAAEDKRSSYFCSCDQTKCDCRFHSQKPGKCICGKELRPMTAKYACDCPGCDCASISMKPGNCVCGRPMKEVK